MPRVHLTVPLRGKACSCATGIASWWCGQCTTCRCLYLRSKLMQWQKPLDRKEVLTFTNKQFLFVFYTQIRDFLFGLWSPGFFWRHDGWDGFAFHPSAPWWATKPWQPTKITKMVPCLDMEQLERGLLVYSRCELENLREWVYFWKPKAVEAKGRKVLLRKKQLWLCTCVKLRSSFMDLRKRGAIKSWGESKSQGHARKLQIPGHRWRASANWSRWIRHLHVATIGFSISSACSPSTSSRCKFMRELFSIRNTMMLSEFDEKKVPALFDSEMGIPVFHVEKENRKQNHSGEMRHATFL